MIKGFLLKLFWQFSGKWTRIDAERMARSRLNRDEIYSVECEKRIREIWNREEKRLRFRLIK